MPIKTILHGGSPPFSTTQTSHKAVCASKLKTAQMACLFTVCGQIKYAAH